MGTTHRSTLRRIAAIAAGMIATDPAKAAAAAATFPAPEADTKILRILDSTGDTVLELKPDTDTGEAATKARAEAEALFKRLKAEGRSAFTFPEKGAKGEGRRIDSLKDAQAETIIIPRVVGG